MGDYPVTGKDRSAFDPVHNHISVKYRNNAFIKHHFYLASLEINYIPIIQKA